MVEYPWVMIEADLLEVKYMMIAVMVGHTINCTTQMEFKEDNQI